nr:unnamed protein product [Digitaria exilis]
MDMDGGSILRVFKNMPRFLAPTRLDLICVYDVPGDFATIVDPAAGRVVLIGGHNPGINTSTLYYSYYSFGRAAPSGVYKVLRVDVAFDGRVQLCEIATIDDDCGSEPAWRERHVPSAITHWYDEEEAKVNGILYFMSCVDDDTPQDCYSIACFDLESEDWTKMIDGPAMGLGKDEKTYWPHSTPDTPQQPMEDAILRQRQHGGGGGGGNASLPEHVIFDVLSWLPAKPLCRFRCVSKAWRALISDPAFVAAQRSRAGPLLVGVFHGPRKPVAYMPWFRDTLELRVMDMHGNVLRVVDDVDQTRLQRMRLGLVCLAHQVFDTGAAMDPATGRALRIGGYLDDPAADDPTTIQFSTFGRAMPSGVYKAVRIYDKFCQIATLEEGAGGAAELTWRQGPAAPFLPCCSSRCTPMEDGVLYFLPCSIHCFVPGRNRVAAFDLETEEWKPVIQFPRATMWPTCLVELNGTLAMVESEEGLCQTNVWLLVDSVKSIWLTRTW